MDELNFLCPECDKEYPKVVQTSRGTCRACGSAKRRAGSRKSLFIQRERSNKRNKEILKEHWDRKGFVWSDYGDIKRKEDA